MQISVDYGNWVTLSGTFDNVSWAWSPCMVDLSEYAGESVRIAFYFTSDVYFPGAGWYIDDVSVITGDYSRNLALETEDFEDGDGDWWADNGLWQVGQPSYGLAAGHSGLKCAGTILHGEYPGQANTRWVTPPFTVPSADQNPRWKMFNWHHMGANDNGWVQISVDGGEWTTIGGPFDNTSAAWTQYLVGLSPYAGQSVRMGLFFTTDVYFPGIGWFVDDVVVASGPWQVRNPEDFEAGHGDWSADNGVWELGVPAYGPAAAHSGENCMGTLIGAESPGEANSRLISPPCTVSGPGENPHVWFYHWYQMGANDRGWIQISVDYGDWQTVIAEPFDDSNPTWTPYMVPLSDYSGHSVRVAFLFTSDVYFPGAGWYIDDFSFEPYVATAKKSWSGLKAGYR